MFWDVFIDSSMLILAIIVVGQVVVYLLADHKED